MKEYWMELLKENGPKKIIMIIVGNKIDLQEKEDVNRDEVRKYAKNENVNFQFTSEKDSTGIDELFNEIGNKYLSPDFNNNEEIN